MGWPAVIARHPRRRRAATVLIIIAAAAGVIVLVVQNLNSPAVGIINSPPPGANVPAAAQPGHYSDNYISFDYPAKFAVNSTDKSPPSLDTVDLLSTDHNDEYAAIAVTRENLSDDSGLQYRARTPGKYTVVKNSDTGVVFSSSGAGSSEYTGYLAHGGLVVSISLTQPGQADLSHDFQAIADSLTWKQ